MKLSWSRRKFSSSLKWIWYFQQIYDTTEKYFHAPNSFFYSNVAYFMFADHFLLPLAAVLLVGIAILLPLTLISKIWWVKEHESISKLLPLFSHLLHLLASFVPQDVKKERGNGLSPSWEEQLCCNDLVPSQSQAESAPACFSWCQSKTLLLSPVLMSSLNGRRDDRRVCYCFQVASFDTSIHVWSTGRFWGVPFSFNQINRAYKEDVSDLLRAHWFCDRGDERKSLNLSNQSRLWRRSRGATESWAAELHLRPPLT